MTPEATLRPESLLDFFRPLLREGLALEEALEQSIGSVPPVAQLYAQLQQSLQAAMTNARRAGRTERDVLEAAFAVIAWLDEVIARYPEFWAGHPPLQKTLFLTNNAGNEFFDPHLKALGPEQDEVREVFFMVMALGFVGQYWFDFGQNSEFTRVVEQQGRQIPVAPAKLHTLAEERVTPQPYLTQDPPGPKTPSHWDRLLLRLAILLAVLVPLALLLYAWLSRPAVQEPPKPDPDILAQLKALEAGLTCKWLRFELAPGTIVKATGVIGDPRELEQFKEAVTRIKGVKTLDSQITHLEWPFCEVYEVFGDAWERSRAQGRPAKVVLNSSTNRFSEAAQQRAVAEIGDIDSKLKESEVYIVPRVTAPANAAAWLYADAYVRKEEEPRYEVAHLLPELEPQRQPGISQAGEQFKLWGPGEEERGKKREPVGYKVRAPHGRELLVLLATPQPLFPGPREPVETVKKYLGQMREMLKNKEIADSMVVDLLFYETER